MSGVVTLYRVTVYIAPTWIQKGDYWSFEPWRGDSGGWCGMDDGGRLYALPDGAYADEGEDGRMHIFRELDGKQIDGLLLNLDDRPPYICDIGPCVPVDSAGFCELRDLSGNRVCILEPDGSGSYRIPRGESPRFSPGDVVHVVEVGMWRGDAS